MHKGTKVPYSEVDVLIEEPVLARPANMPRRTATKVDLKAVRSEVEEPLNRRVSPSDHKTGDHKI